MSARPTVTTDAEVYETHAPALIRFATGIVGPDEAADTVSTAVLSALSSQSWSTVEDKRAYLYRCVLNAAHADHRSKARRREREQRVVHLEGNRVAPPVESSPNAHPGVFNAVRELSERQRAIVFLTYWEDLDAAAVARLLDISEGTVKQHLARARTHLRRKLHV